MKVKALDTIAGYYGVKSPGQVFEIRAGEGQALIDQGLAELVDTTSTPEDEPRQGEDMTRTKTNKVAANRTTKEEKGTQEDK